MDVNELEKLRERVRAASSGNNVLDLDITGEIGVGLDTSDAHQALAAVAEIYPAEPEMQMSILRQAIDLGKRPEKLRDRPVIEWLALAIVDELLAALIVKARTGG